MENPGLVRFTGPRLSLRVQGLGLGFRVSGLGLPNNHILTQNLYYNYYYPTPKYLIIGYMDP